MADTQDGASAAKPLPRPGCWGSRLVAQVLTLEGCLPRRSVAHLTFLSASLFDLDHAVRILAFDEPRGLHRVILPVAVTARRAVDPDFKLRACHCG